MKQNQTDKLAAIAFVQDRIKAEIQRLSADLGDLLEKEKVPASAREKILRTVATEIGALNGRMQVVEAAVARISGSSTVSRVAGLALEETGRRVEFPVAWYQGHPNLWPLENNGTTSYCWTGKAPDTEFRLPLDRSRPLQLKIHIQALVKPEFGKKMRILVDGNPVRHKFYQEREYFVSRCNLPAREGSDQTRLLIRLPATFSSRELGTGEDDRKMGLALISFVFVKAPARRRGLFGGRR